VNAVVEVPAAVSKAFAAWARSGRIAVEGRLNQAALRTTLMPVGGGGHRLYLNGGLRTAAGVDVGDEVLLTLRPTQPDEVVAAADVVEAFDAAGVRATFEGLAPSHRREWIRYIDDARSAPARAARLAFVATRLAGDRPPRASDHAARRRKLWTCPECGNEFVNRNQYHSCATHTVDEVLTRMSGHVRALFDCVRTMVEANGPVKIVAYRDRVAFMVRVRFAGVTPRARWLDLSLWLPERVESSRWHRVETLTPNATVHVLRVTDGAQLDEEVAGWVARAYAVGRQDHLAEGTFP
jgi:hypothetical protein